MYLIVVFFGLLLTNNAVDMKKYVTLEVHYIPTYSYLPCTHRNVYTISTYEVIICTGCASLRIRFVFRVGLLFD